MIDPTPIKGQGGFAQKVQDTAAERDRLKVVNAELVKALRHEIRQGCKCGCCTRFNAVLAKQGAGA